MGGAMSVATAPTAALPKRRKSAADEDTAERRRTIRTAFAFLAPSLIGVVLFLLIPIVFVIGLSLVQWNMLTPMKWVGLSNYVNIFEFDGFGHSLIVTLYYVILNIPIQTAFALGMAMLLRQKHAGSGVIRIIAVLPFLSTPVAMGVVWNWIFNPSTGLVNQFLAHLGIAGPAWLSNEATAMPVIAFANIWQYAGYNMLFFLAGLGAIPLSLYEAAALDGTSRWRTFWKITFPLLRPAHFFVLVVFGIGALKVFDQAFLVSGGMGGPNYSTMTAVLYIYLKAFHSFEMGVAAAAGVVLFVIIFGLTVIQRFTIGRQEAA